MIEMGQRAGNVERVSRAGVSSDNGAETPRLQREAADGKRLTTLQFFFVRLRTAEFLGFSNPGTFSSERRFFLG